jgi:hypothetical protein
MAIKVDRVLDTTEVVFGLQEDSLRIGRSRLVGSPRQFDGWTEQAHYFCFFLYLRPAAKRAEETEHFCR